MISEEFGMLLKGGIISITKSNFQIYFEIAQKLEILELQKVCQQFLTFYAFQVRLFSLFPNENKELISFCYHKFQTIPESDPKKLIELTIRKCKIHSRVSDNSSPIVKDLNNDIFLKFFNQISVETLNQDKQSAFIKFPLNHQVRKSLVLEKDENSPVSSKSSSRRGEKLQELCEQQKIQSPRFQPSAFLPKK